MCRGIFGLFSYFLYYHLFVGFRHTFATRSLESGMNVKTLSKLLGHSNVGFTMDVYTHVTEQLQIEEISGLQDFL